MILIARYDIRQKRVLQYYTSKELVFVDPTQPNTGEIIFPAGHACRGKIEYITYQVPVMAMKSGIKLVILNNIKKSFIIFGQWRKQTE